VSEIMSRLTRSLPSGARLAWLIVISAGQLLYFPINRAAQGGAVLATPLDAWIPLWPIWAIPYLLSLVWWLGCFIWAALRMDPFLYRAFIAAILSVLMASYAVYLLYPTYVERPPLEGASWPICLMRFIYSNDRVNNAFPSGHTYNTMLILFLWWRWRPRHRWVWVGVSVIVLLSTLFTRQHNLPDLLGGIALAWLGSRFGLWWAARHGEE
jgi:membrane-associated phospholipid phosphatase